MTSSAVCWFMYSQMLCSRCERAAVCITQATKSTSSRVAARMVTSPRATVDVVSAIPSPFRIPRVTLLEKVARGFGWANARWGRLPADELLSRRPSRHVLVAVLRVADEGDVVDVDAKEMEPRLLRPPAEHGDRFAVPRSLYGIAHRDGAPSHLHLSFPPISVGDDAVHEDAVVAKEIGGLARLPHHREPQVTVEDERLHRAQAGRAVGTDRAHQEHPRRDEALVGDAGQSRRPDLEVLPTHGAISLAPAPAVIP